MLRTQPMPPRPTAQTQMGTDSLHLFFSFFIRVSHFLRSYAFDPILRYRPAFARSLPVQILMIGIILTLTSVLLIHLLFTARYHWPLAPVNYALQMSAVTTLLISLIATLRVVLQTTTEVSQQWPYMLNYIAVDIPPLQDDTASWAVGELAAWLLMNAATSALIQVSPVLSLVFTHIRLFAAPSW